MQLPSTDRALLFWGACLPARYFFATLVAPLYPNTSRTLAALVGAR